MIKFNSDRELERSGFLEGDLIQTTGRDAYSNEGLEKLFADNFKNFALPDDPAPNGQVLLESRSTSLLHLGQGKICSKQGLHMVAIDHFQQAIKSDSKLKDDLTVLGKLIFAYNSFGQQLKKKQKHKKDNNKAILENAALTLKTVNYYVDRFWNLAAAKSLPYYLNVLTVGMSQSRRLADNCFLFKGYHLSDSRHDYDDDNFFRITDEESKNYKNFSWLNSKCFIYGEEIQQISLVLEKPLPRFFFPLMIESAHSLGKLIEVVAYGASFLTDFEAQRNTDRKDFVSIVEKITSASLKLHLKDLLKDY